MLQHLWGRRPGTPTDLPGLAGSLDVVDPDFDADNEDYIASLVAEVARGHTIMADGGGTLWGHPPATVRPWRREPTPAKYLQYVEPAPEKIDPPKVAKAKPWELHKARMLAEDKAYAARCYKVRKLNKGQARQAAEAEVAAATRKVWINEEALAFESGAYLRSEGVDCSVWTSEQLLEFFESFREHRARGELPPIPTAAGKSAIPLLHKHTQKQENYNG